MPSHARWRRQDHPSRQHFSGHVSGKRLFNLPLAVSDSQSPANVLYQTRHALMSSRSESTSKGTGVPPVILDATARRLAYRPAVALSLEVFDSVDEQATVNTHDRDSVRSILAHNLGVNNFTPLPSEACLPELPGWFEGDLTEHDKIGQKSPARALPAVIFIRTAGKTSSYGELNKDSLGRLKPLLLSTFPTFTIWVREKHSTFGHDVEVHISASSPQLETPCDRVESRRDR